MNELADSFEGYTSLETFRPGIYLHYKGQLYEADHFVHDANYEGRVGVHYVGLELDGAHEGPRHAVRTWEDWTAYVHRDGTTCEDEIDGECKAEEEEIAPRFRYLGPVFRAEMMDLDPWSSELED